MTTGRIVWITGRPASGKTTLARGIIEKLRAANTPVLWLDSDDLRTVLTPNATYSDEEREHFYNSVAHLAKLGAEGGVTVVVSATAPQRGQRERARSFGFPFFEIWITCDREVLRTRDIKGLYAKSQSGEITNLPGVGADYEPPKAADLVLDSGKLAPDDMIEAASKLLIEPERS